MHHEYLKGFTPVGEPNYELLREAYAIIGGIPMRKIHLRKLITEGGLNRPVKELKCGTIACGAGWLALHPMFTKLGLRISKTAGYRSHTVLGWKGDFTEYESQYERAMARVFNMKMSDADDMFSALVHYGESNLSDKAKLLRRIKNYLIARGQTMAQLAANTAARPDQGVAA